MLWTALAESKQHGCCALSGCFTMWLLHYVWTTSGCCSQGVALLLTYVGGGLLRPYFACALSSAALFSIIWGDVHPQVLLRPVSLPVDNDEIACHHSSGGHDMILFNQ